MNTGPARRLLTGAMLAMLLAGSAGAVGFVNDRNGWLGLTEEAKAAYVQGLNDSLNHVFVDDNLVEALAKRGRTMCLAERQETAATLATRITAAYGDDRFATFSPTAIYILNLGEICRGYINRERAQFGLGPV